MTTALGSEHGGLPLAPVDVPSNLFVRLLLSAARKRYGKTPTAFRVIYTRAPMLAVVSVMIGIAQQFMKLEAPLRSLVSFATAQSAGCTFCADLHAAEAAKQRIGTERFRQLHEFEQSAHFSERERAALAYVQALAQSLHVSDAVWERLSTHFSERERVEIVWLCAVERYFNGMALPLRIGSDNLLG